MIHPPRTQGFTLIELSIVIVVIALVAGGVLLSRDLIQAAQVRAQLGQIEQLTTAVRTFRVKYGQLPGDISNAASLGLGTSAAWHNGNGDGSVNAPCMYSTYHAWAGANKEGDNFFYHLSRANLIDGAFEGYMGEPHGTLYTPTTLNARFVKPKIATVTDAWIFPSRFSAVATCTQNGISDPSVLTDGGNGFQINGHDMNISFQASVNSDLVRAMDQKTDDGLPRTGSINSANTGWGTKVHINADSDGGGKCSNGTSNAYPTAATNCRPSYVNRF